MSKLHVDSLVPDRNVVSAKVQSFTVSPKNYYYQFEFDLDASGTLTINMPAGHVTEWFSVYFWDAPSNNETNLVLFLDGDDTSDATKGWPVQYYLDSAFYHGDGDNQQQDAAPQHFRIRAKQLTFLSGEANNTFFVYLRLIEEKNIVKNTRRWLNT